MATLTIVVERDRSKLPAHKYRAKIRAAGKQQFSGSLHGSVAKARLDVENAFDRPFIWQESEDPASDIRCTATVEIEITGGAR